MTLYSLNDRNAIVRGFIALRGKGQVVIKDFTPIARYLNDGTIKRLCFIRPNALKEMKINNETKFLPIYDQNNAEDYLNWLITTISIDETATEKTINDAYIQLFKFIFALRDKMNVNLDTFLKVSFEWENWFFCLDHDFVELKQNMEYKYNRTIDVLEKIGNWQKDFQPRLEKLEKIQKKADNFFRGKPNTPKRNN
jgi:hypothetical protein